MFGCSIPNEDLRALIDLYESRLLSLTDNQTFELEAFDVSRFVPSKRLDCVNALLCVVSWCEFIELRINQRSCLAKFSPAVMFIVLGSSCRQTLLRFKTSFGVSINE